MKTIETSVLNKQPEDLSSSEDDVCWCLPSRGYFSLDWTEMQECFRTGKCFLKSKASVKQLKSISKKDL